MQKLLCLLHNKSTQNIQIKEEKPKKSKIILRNAVMPCLKKKEKPIEIKQEKKPIEIKQEKKPVEIKQEKKPVEKKLDKSVKKTKKNDVITSQNLNKKNIKSNTIKEKQNKPLTKEDVY